MTFLILLQTLLFPLQGRAHNVTAPALLEQSWFAGFADPGACAAYQRRVADPAGGTITLQEVTEVDPANPPVYQYFQIDDSTYVLRQNKCLTYEGPFLYLLVGTLGKAMLIDSGATRDEATNPLVNALRTLVKKKNLSISTLSIFRSHSHGDHIAGEALFEGWPEDGKGCHVGKDFPTVCLVTNVYEALGFSSSPEDERKTVSLGDRELLALPCPGHAPDSILYYDRGTQLLFTGDSLYPGFIFHGSSDAHGRCLVRAVQFIRQTEVGLLLGAHIERDRDNAPIRYGSSFNRNEHPLALDKDTVFEMCQDHSVCAKSLQLSPAERERLEKRGKNRAFTLQ